MGSDVLLRASVVVLREGRVMLLGTAAAAGFLMLLTNTSSSDLQVRAEMPVMIVQS